MEKKMMETNNHSYTMEARVMMKTKVDAGISALRIGDGEFGIELKTEETEGGELQYKAYGLYGGESRISAVCPLPYDNWRHIALTAAYDGSTETSTLTLHMDGGETAKTDWNDKVSHINADIKIDNLFSHKVGEIRLWNVARTECEIKTDRLHSLTGREAGLMTYLPLVSPHALFPFAGKCLEVYGAAGTDSSADVMQISDSRMPRISMEFWARIKHAGAGDIITYESADHADMVSVSGFENVEIRICGETVKTGINIADGAWHHMAVTWRSLTGRLAVYKNGKREFKGALAGENLLPDTGILRLGGHLQLSDLRIWDTVRPPEEIAWDMFFRLAGTEPGLTGYWKLDGDNANTATIEFPITNLDRAGRWVDSGLLLRDPIMFQAKAMRDQWDSTHNQDVADVAIEEDSSCAVGFDALIDSLNTQITDARKESQDKEYYLGDVSMQLKAIPLSAASGDSKMIFPSRDQLEKIESDQLSTVNLNFYPKYKPRRDARV